MAFDGLFMHAITHELNNKLSSGRINKISLPFPYEIILTVIKEKQKMNLLLSAQPDTARIQITKSKFSNPIKAPTFEMVLRRHLQGGKIFNFQQIGNDRLLRIDITNKNELGDSYSYKLLCEIMGRHSNIFLLDHNNQILELIKHVHPSENRVRPLLPNFHYSPPPKQGLTNPFKDSTFISKDAEKIRKHYEGLSKLSALEASKQIHLSEWFNRFNHPKPTLTKLASNKYEFTVFPYKVLSGKTFQFPSLSELLDFYYQKRSTQIRIKELSSQINQILKRELKKNLRKQTKLNKTLKKSKSAQNFKVKGELLTTYQYQIKNRQEKVTLNDYNTGKKLLIKLDPNITVNANAQKYFKKYHKLKKSVPFLKEQAKEAQKEINYFQNIKNQLTYARLEDLDQIKIELIQEGYLKTQRKKLKQIKRRNQNIKPDVFFSNNGTKIEIGKNNLQNDQLSLKTAKKDDIWLHTQKIPGPHVIIHSSHPSPQTLEEAAMLAAHFSKAPDSTKIAVDYLPAGKLNKPQGAKPGFVTFKGQKTIYISTNPKVIKQLEKNKNKSYSL